MDFGDEEGEFAASSKSDSNEPILEASDEIEPACSSSSSTNLSWLKLEYPAGGHSIFFFWKGTIWREAAASKEYRNRD